jgi:hypothetical protein
VIQRSSLAGTVDAVNAAHFSGATIPAGVRRETALWLAGRQGLPGAYGNTFAGFPAERSQGITLFTGERIASASARHILGEETSRALRLLRVRDRAVTQALARADEGMHACLTRAAEGPRRDNPGLYCCGKCSVGLWRNLLAGGLDRQEERLERGVAHLQGVRDGKGQWRKFPFWYTVLALAETSLPAASRELEYAADELQRVVDKAPRATSYAQRRHQLARRALARI